MLFEIDWSNMKLESLTYEASGGFEQSSMQIALIITLASDSTGYFIG
jgi:hypothetical protein